MTWIDPTTLASWVQAHSPGLLLYARQWVDAAAAAEDVVQDVFIRLAGLPERPAHIRAWLLTSVRNAAIDALRKHKRDAARIHEVAQQRLFDPRPDHPSPLLAEEVEAALQRLAPDQREVVVLRIWAAATFDEIAAVTGLPLSTVYLRYTTALTDLKTRWEQPCPRK